MTNMEHRIKEQPEDFVVEEITLSGETLDAGKNYSFDENSAGEQLICVMRKRNWDTTLAVREIAKRLKISKSRVSFAGMKDKRALTCQLISIYKMKKEDAEKLRIKDIDIFPLRYSKEKIDLGDLKGNHFRIIVHSYKKPKAIKQIANYYGEQRFGGSRANSAEIGRLIIDEKFEEAVLRYLTEISKTESEEATNARKKLGKDLDFKTAYKEFPQSLKFERMMLSRLAEKKDYINALKALPKKLLMMLIHAYQSKLFNEYLDEVIKRKLNYTEGPLFGYKYEITNELEKEILKKNDIWTDNFLIRDFPEMSMKGAKRELFVDVEGLKIKELEKNKYLVEFSLPKSCYATVVIEQMF